MYLCLPVCVCVCLSISPSIFLSMCVCVCMCVCTDTFLAEAELGCTFCLGSVSFQRLSFGYHTVYLSVFAETEHRVTVVNRDQHFVSTAGVLPGLESLQQAVCHCV